MKKLSQIAALPLALALIATTLTGCGGDKPSQPSSGGEPGGDTTQGSVTLQWAFTPPDGSTDHIWHQKVAKLASENTGGAITYEFYPGGILGNEKVALEGILSGTINQASISPNVVATVIPEFNVLCLPFVFDSIEHFYAVVSSDEYYEKMNEAANKVGLQYLGLDYAAPRNIATKSPVYTPDDAKGQVLRVMDGSIYTDMMAAWGFGSSVISYGEVYTALQQGVVDGVENSNDGNLTMKFNEVAPCATNTDHVYHAQSTFMNLELWNSFSQEIRDGIEQAWKENFSVIVGEVAGLGAEFSEKVKEAGGTVIDLDAESRQIWVDASQSLYEKYRGVIGEEFYDWFIGLAESKK